MKAAAAVATEAESAVGGGKRKIEAAPVAAERSEAAVAVAE